MELLVVLAVGLAAGTLSGIVGFGSSIMLMPVLVLAFGPVQAVPIMAISALMANLSRVLAWWREIDWPACFAYAATAVPGAALGAQTMLALPPSLVEGALGGFFIGMIPLRRWMAAREFRVRRWHLALTGAPIGFVTGVVVSTGPITAPLFLAYGLVKGAFLATEAASSLLVYGTKAGVFRMLGALPWDVAAKGLVAGSTLMFGTFLAKRFVIRFEPAQFRLLMEGLMLVSGLVLLGAALV